MLEWGWTSLVMSSHAGKLMLQCRCVGRVTDSRLGTRDIEAANAKLRAPRLESPDLLSNREDSILERGLRRMMMLHR